MPLGELKKNNVEENIFEQFKEVIRDAIKEATHEHKLTLTVEEAARYTGIGRDKILELAHNPESGFPAFRVGTKFLINRELLKEWLKKVAEERKVL
ncbi:excisionase [Caldanaerobacter subterraneus subsp. yonseiensis KB-1]|uniref:Excisionase n=1 Tax=Caldanaerobacter subterraneus subsp. yonseiensis KB-1 TaxID=1388761 RepID=U5CRF2_CALSX|nr:helix-turn-helix domain-containing protein [Caldanaerobacter subterraneus]ERM91531.1 excisionase [Caldanaerobacter subterraneus subsp. yonseiensis KB-1]